MGQSIKYSTPCENLASPAVNRHRPTFHTAPQAFLSLAPRRPGQAFQGRRHDALQPLGHNPTCVDRIGPAHVGKAMRRIIQQRPDLVRRRRVGILGRSRSRRRRRRLTVEGFASRSGWIVPPNPARQHPPAPPGSWQWVCPLAARDVDQRRWEGLPWSGGPVRQVHGKQLIGGIFRATVPETGGRDESCDGMAYGLCKRHVRDSGILVPPRAIWDPDGTILLLAAFLLTNSVVFFWQVMLPFRTRPFVSPS